MKTAMTAASLFTLAAGLAGAADRLTVTPAMSYGWSTQTQSTATGEFVDGNAPAGYGTGSYQMMTGAGGTGPGTGGKVWLSTNQYNGVKLADVTALSYETYVAVSSETQNLTPSIQLQIDTNGDGVRDTTLVFEPVYSVATQGAVQKGRWQTWDARHGTWWATTDTVLGPAFTSYFTWDQFVQAYPQATIVQWSNQPSGYGVEIVAGQNSPGAPWKDFAGNVDAFSITAGGQATEYDFELYSVPTDKDQCKNGGWMTFNPSFGKFKNQGDCVSFVATGGKRS